MPPGTTAQEVHTPTVDTDAALERHLREMPQCQDFIQLHARRMEDWKVEKQKLDRSAQEAREREVKLAQLQHTIEELQTRQAALRQEIAFYGNKAARKEALAEARTRRVEADRAFHEAQAGCDQANLRLQEAKADQQKKRAEKEAADQESVELQACCLSEGEALQGRVEALQREVCILWQGWRELETLERCAELRREALREGLAREAESRQALQEEARRLVEQLRRLERQLDGHPPGSDTQVVAEAVRKLEQQRGGGTPRSLDAAVP